MGFILLKEIEEILSMPGRTILFHGDIGSGKSTIVRQILTTHFKKALYISTVKPVEENLGIWFSNLDSFENINEKLMHLKDKRGILLAESSRGTYLSKARSVIKLRHKSIEEFISELYISIKENEIEAFALDSIDPILQNEKEKLYELINVSHKTRTIGLFVTKSLDDPVLLTLFDGIIYLRKAEYKGRLLRTLTFEKMSGIQLNQIRYIFTLYGKRAKVFTGEDWNKIRFSKFTQDYYNPEKGIYSSCSESFDQFLDGGFKETNVYHFHLGINIPNSLIPNLFECFVSKWLFQNYKIQIISSPIYTLQSLQNLFESVISPELINKNVKIATLNNLQSNNIQIVKPIKRFIENWWSERKKSEAPTLHFIVTDILDNEFGYKDAQIFLLELSRLIRNSNDILIIITKEGSSTNIESIKLSEISTQINEVEGAYVMTKIKPADRKVYGLDLKKVNETYIPQVIPIV